MMNRFEILDISCNFYQGVSKDDERIKHLNMKCSSCTYGHLDMIYQFYYNTTKPYGIFCEDDILIHKDFKKHLNNIISDFESLHLDVLLLGYLITFDIRDNSYNGFTDIDKNTLCSIDSQYKYYTYPDKTWGTQMYMLTRENAKKLLDKYYNGYAEKYLKDNSLTLFSSDHTITKDGNRALLYPLLVIEDGKTKYNHDGQQWFHYYSYFNNYSEGDFI